MTGQRSRHKAIAAMLIAPLLLGALLGVFASRGLWGYFWSVPAIQLPELSNMEAASFFYAKPFVEVVPSEERSSHIEGGIRVCQITVEDCNSSRIIDRLGGRRLEDLPPVSSQEVVDTVGLARALSPIAFFRHDQKGYGLVVRFSHNVWLVTFHTEELPSDQGKGFSSDSHGYVELLVDRGAPSPRVLESASYFFDVTGLEFLTPPVLVCGCIVVLYIIGGGLFAVLLAIRRLRRDA